MSSAKWSPTDAELDALARELPPFERTADAAEQNRTRMLASAATAAQRSRRSRMPFVIAGALAAAAAVAIWFALPEGRTTAPKESIVAIGEARFERANGWPDYQLRVHEGQLAVELSQLAATDRFRVIATDTWIDVRSARFVVHAKLDRIELLLVEKGSVEVHHANAPAVTLLAGSRWTPPVRTASVVPAVPAAPAAAPAVPVAPVEPARPSKRATVARGEAPLPRTKPQDVRPEPAVSTEPAPSPAKSTPAPSPGDAKSPPPPSAGEAEFRKGWTALRANDPKTATAAFAVACAQLRGEALGEDSCFWLGVAAKRAGNLALARDALATFVAQFPSASRGGEASALLGWMRYDIGDLDGAQRAFERATRDRSPSVRASAEKGLTAVERKRNVP